MLKGRDVKGKEAVKKKARNSLRQAETALTPDSLVWALTLPTLVSAALMAGFTKSAARPRTQAVAPFRRVGN